MKRALRALVGAALLVGGVVGISSSATAAPDDALTPCQELEAGYTPSGICDLRVEVTPVCEDGDVPVLAYSGVVRGTTASSVTIRWVNPNGDDIVMADQPLTGEVRWPGTVVDANGRTTDWPGWTKDASGTWVEGDEFSWTRPTVRVEFTVNPTATTVVTYPPATVACGPANAAAGAAVLSATGATVTPLLLGAGGLVVLGGLALVVARTRRTAHEH
ncbi:peptidase [Actinotalea subterranea]|uniref:peptidase n=1 Tax=Actinotalea subterranea TaxID=2607497 RepID=UPI0011EDACA7|nr:peptidase [Actinotalea subterranea]